MNNEKEEWEKEFDEQFVKDLGSEAQPVWQDAGGTVGPVKAFIRQQREQARREGYEEALEELTKEFWTVIAEAYYPDRRQRLIDLKARLNNESK